MLIGKASTVSFCGELLVLMASFCMWVSGYAGSIHDARVLRMSSLLPAIENGDILHSPMRRIGGTHSLLLSQLINLRPGAWNHFLRPEPWPIGNEISINHRAVQEWLWRRHLDCWRGGGGGGEVEKVSSAIIACCILHNSCLEVNDPTEIDVVSDGNGFPRVPLPGHDMIKKHHKRQFVLKLYFVTFFLQRLVHFHFSFHILSKTNCHSGTSYFIINMHVMIKNGIYEKFQLNWKIILMWLKKFTANKFNSDNNKTSMYLMFTSNKKISVLAWFSLQTSLTVTIIKKSMYLMFTSNKFNTNNNKN